MVEEGGVEPPFLPNFTMQLSCELIRAFNPFSLTPCALHSSYLQVTGKRCPARSLILFFTLKT